MTNKDIIKQYIDTGISIPEYQFNKLTISLLRTYLRKRLIASIESIYSAMETSADINDEGFLSYKMNCEFLEDYEIDKLSDKQRDEYDEAVEEVPEDLELETDDFDEGEDWDDE